MKRPFVYLLLKVFDKDDTRNENTNFRWNLPTVKVMTILVRFIGVKLARDHSRIIALAPWLILNELTQTVIRQSIDFSDQHTPSHNK